MTITKPVKPRPPLWKKLSIASGNLIQSAGLAVGAALLTLAASMTGPGPARLAVALLGFPVIYDCSHAIGHYLAGRAAGIRFRFYGIRGTDHPEDYPPGFRQLMSAAPFWSVVTDKDSMRAAAPWKKALMFAAGETSTAIVGRSRSRGATPANPITLCDSHGTDLVTVTGQILMAVHNHPRPVISMPASITAINAVHASLPEAHPLLPPTGRSPAATARLALTTRGASRSPVMRPSRHPAKAATRPGRMPGAAPCGQKAAPGAAGQLSTSSWRSTPSRSSSSQCSISPPRRTRWMWMPLTVTRRPVAGTPTKSPAWVPVALHRVTTSSSSTT